MMFEHDTDIRSIWNWFQSILHGFCSQFNTVWRPCYISSGSTFFPKFDRVGACSV